MTRLRFALLYDGTSFEEWHLRCLEELEPHAELVGAVVMAPPHEAPTPAAGRTGRALRRFFARHPGATRRVDARGRLAGVLVVSGGASSALAEPDFILQLGRGTPPAGIETAARHGLWSFAHELGDDDPPFLREVHDGSDVTYAALLQRAAGAEAPAALQEAWLRTERRSYAAHRDGILRALAGWPALVCRRVLAHGIVAAHPPAVAAPPARGESPPGALRLIVGIGIRRLRFAYQRLFSHLQWNIGVVDAPIETVVRPGGWSDGAVAWFPLRGRTRFLADPFGIAQGGRLRVLCEDFDYRTARGVISSIEATERGFVSQPAPALAQDGHLSYPFLLEHDGVIWCVPESSQAGEIALYRAEDFPRRWRKEAVLVARFAGVDPTVFRHGGRWWLLATERGGGGAQEDAALFAWHAEALQGPWTPHALNPVKMDVRGARPAGTPFVVAGALHRPAQDCSRAYGWRIVIQRVATLTPTAFAEEPVAVLEASRRSPYPLGRHTIARVGNAVLVDGHRRVFVWHALTGFLRVWARDLTRGSR